jgi:uncharacterized protein (DUF885 family)
MRAANLCSLLVMCSLFVGCDTDKEADLGIPQTKSVHDLKQSKKSKLSDEELAEERRKAGFKSHEEQMAEAKETYEKMSKGYVKGRLPAYRDLLAALRKEMTAVEKAAASFGKAKDPEAAHAKFNEKYADTKKAFIERYNDLTEKGAQGGDLQIELEKAVRGWEGLVNGLNPEVAADEGFPAALAEIRKQIDAVEEELAAIEKDESIEADEVEEK